MGARSLLSRCRRRGRQRFAARLIVGGGTLLMLAVMNLIALGIDLPQILAGLYVKTGLLKPLPVLSPGVLYGLIIALPFAMFAFSFTFSSLTHSRMLVMLSWFWGALGSVVTAADRALV